MGEQVSERFRVHVSVRDESVDVRAVGEIDIATVGVLRSALWAAPSRSVLRVDLSGVRLLSAAGVRALAAAHLRVRAQGGELVLVDPAPVVARVLRVTGLHRVVPVVEASRPVAEPPAPVRPSPSPLPSPTSSAPSPLAPPAPTMRHVPPAPAAQPVLVAA
ncbi:anti-sigma factor antagonist [Micromonospora musae]|uniref:Anti-sigma factor antagonist n=1 Tax=Micromonospora musae TaxID=1894970 RepID=A0ABX9QXH3_9ACTN|nr:anti-sigma factor antagonist [Micromonospora musae]